MVTNGSAAPEGQPGDALADRLARLEAFENTEQERALKALMDEMVDLRGAGGAG
jgi:hypothetical protein